MFQRLRRLRPGAAKHGLPMTSLWQRPTDEAQEVHLSVCRKERQTDKPQRWQAQALLPWHRAEKASWDFQSLRPR